MGANPSATQNGKREARRQVQVSIIIPSFNGGELVGKTLRAVAAQETSLPFEIVVVDSGSAPETMSILHGFPIRLIRIPHEQFNHGLTRDLGAEQARGEILVFLNQDAEPGTTTWLDRMVAPLHESGRVLAVQGRVRVRDDRPGFFWNACHRGFAYTSETRRWEREHFSIGLSTVNCAIRRSVWARVRFGAMVVMEDKAFQAKIQLQGGEIVYSDAWVYHSHEYTWRQLRKTILDEGFGWSLVGVRYSFRQLLGDWFRLRKYSELFRGLIQGKVRSAAEVFFPLVRPLWLYRGNHMSRNLLKE